MAKKTAYTGVMLALAMIFSYIESLLSLPAPVPGIKLGLANLVILLLLYRDGTGLALTVNLARIFLTALLFGNLKKGGKARLTCSNDGLELESGPAPKAAGKAPKNTRNALA